MQDFFQGIGPILGGLAGVAAVMKVLYDKRQAKSQHEVAVKQVKVSADDVAVQNDANVIEGYAKLLSEHREQFEDYREYTDRRFAEMSAEIEKLREESNLKDEKILLLRIDRDTLIQHAIIQGAVPLPNLHTT